MPKKTEEAFNKAKRTQMLKSRARKLELVNRFGNKCAHCQQTFPPCCYDFHHLDPTQKDKKITQLTGASLEKLEAEVLKCIMVCSNCHRIIHAYKEEVNA